MQGLLVTIFSMLCVCYAAPNRWAADRVVHQHNDYWNPRGYTFGYETSLGNSRKEKAIMKENDKGNKFFDLQGEYSYVMPDGTSYTVLYKANERGYQQSPPVMLKGKYSKYDALKPKRTLPLADGAGHQNAIENDHKVNISIQIRHDNSSNNSVSPQLITDEELQLIFNENSTDVTSTTESVESTTMDSGNETDIDGVGDRVGLPSDVIGSLLG